MARLRSLLTALWLIVAISCAAQSGGGLPDSINTSEEKLPPPSADTVTNAPPDSAAAGAGAADSAARDVLIPSTDTVVFRAVPDSAIVRYQGDRDFAYANDSAYWKIIHPGAPKGDGLLEFLIKLFSSKGFRYFLYMLLAAVLLYALYKITKENKLHLFYRRGPRKGGAPGTEEGANLLEEDLDKKIAEALRAGDHRLGTRYLFLKTLRLLDERELIHYQAKATNHEYILQMSPHRQARDFQFLAGAYEHVWYGDFPLNEQQFDRLLHYFQDFYKTIATLN